MQTLGGGFVGIVSRISTAKFPCLGARDGADTRPDLRKRRARGYQDPPNARSVLASTATHSSVRSSPRTSAIARIVSGTR